MNKDLAISVQKVSKVYKLYDKNIDRLKEVFDIRKKVYHKEFYALDSLSFDVKKGSTVGIIGTNGSGKSTILKIITGVLSQSSGKVLVDGNISALLELGAGFNVDYTGMENLYMNGSMLGFSKKEMDKKIPEILEFAEIGDFINQPVKTYSSGMFVRLAFSLAINVNPDILIVDEALSVGDVFFQAKCYTKMEEIRNKGTTILLVTHDMGSVIKYCDEVILINRGKLLSRGNAKEMVNLYKKILSGIDIEGEQDLKSKPEENIEDNKLKDKFNINKNLLEYGNLKAKIVDFAILDSKKDLSSLLIKGEEFTIKEKILFDEEIKNPIFTFTLKDKKGTELTGTNTLIENIKIESVKKGDIYEVEFTQKMNLNGGEYLLSISCTGFNEGNLEIYHRLYDVLSITVISNKNTVGIYDMYTKVATKLIRS